MQAYVADQFNLPDSEKCIAAIDLALSKLSDISIAPNSTDCGDACLGPEDVIQKYAPVHLREEFKDLYSYLSPCLLPNSPDDTCRSSRGTSNASAFLFGPRGSGKSLVLRQCLQAIVDQQHRLLRSQDQVVTNQQSGMLPFRLVQLHGIVQPGANVGIIVREILRQLTTSTTNGMEKQLSNEGREEEDKEKMDQMRKTNKRGRTVQHELLKLKQTTFTNDVQLLNEILQLANVDGVPILFVLDEIDAFVANAASVGALMQGGGGGTGYSGTEMASRQLLLYHLLDRVASHTAYISVVGMTSHQGTMELLEKRIRSRAEGTARFIQFGPCRSFDHVRDILQDKLSTLKTEACALLYAPDTQDDSPKSRLYCSLQRNYRLGKDVRWFCHVFSTALSWYRLECQLDSCAKLRECIFLDAIAAHGGILVETACGEKNNITSRTHAQILLDLSGPALALMLAARRILIRDGQKGDETSASTTIPPLSLERMRQELKSFKGHHQYSFGPNICHHAFEELLLSALVRPALDHSGIAPFQYQHQYFLDEDFMRLPLHVTLDVFHDLDPIIKKSNKLRASTALLEWGRKVY